MRTLTGFLITGTLLFTTTAYYLLKNYLVEWGCRKFLKGKVKLYSDVQKEKDTAQNGVNGHAHAGAVNGIAKFAKEGSKVTVLTRGDLAEVAQL